jgi:hypothetical protein
MVLPEETCGRADEKEVAAACRKWKTRLECDEKNGLRAVHLLVDEYFPEKEIRTPETAAAVAQSPPCRKCASG